MGGMEIFLIAASAATSAIGAINAADAKADNLNAQAAAAQNNAVIAQQNARNTQLVSGANEAAQRRKSAHEMGTLRAGLLQSGIGAEGTAADVIGQAAGNAELDALNIRYDGTLRASNFEQQGLMQTQQAAASRQGASNAQDAGYLGAAASLLSGAGKMMGGGKAGG